MDHPFQIANFAAVAPISAPARIVSATSIFPEPTPQQTVPTTMRRQIPPTTATPIITLGSIDGSEMTELIPDPSPVTMPWRPFGLVEVAPIDFILQMEEKEHGRTPIFIQA
jgi:hypothetical protein